VATLWRFGAVVGPNSHEVKSWGLCPKGASPAEGPARTGPSMIRAMGMGRCLMRCLNCMPQLNMLLGASRCIQAQAVAVPMPYLAKSNVGTTT
jgi:hypothetical protein